VLDSDLELDLGFRRGGGGFSSFWDFSFYRNFLGGENSGLYGKISNRDFRLLTERQCLLCMVRIHAPE